MSQLNEITGCEVCGARQLRPVLDLGPHPMCDDLVPVGDSRTCREYPIEILYCDTCRTAHQRFQIPKQELFPRSYHYRSRFTADVLGGMKSLVAAAATQFGPLAGKKVLDVGSNDGSLLDFFREQGAVTIGVEPTGASADAAAKGHATFNEFFSPQLAPVLIAAHGQPDFITFTNVFAHIEDLASVVQALRLLMHKDTVVIIENHFLGAVLDGGQFDTFYHEHPRTYSATSFRHIARSLGVDLLAVEFPARYGGNIRVSMGRASAPAGALEGEIEAREQRYPAQFEALRARVGTWAVEKRRQIDALAALHGPLRAKAFPGRAAILVKLLGLDTSHIQAVHEKPGSMKIGNYVPGTRIPIASDDELFSSPATTAPMLNLAWHIPAEIRKYLASAGWKGEVIDILTPEELGQRP